MRQKIKNFLRSHYLLVIFILSLITLFISLISFFLNGFTDFTKNSFYLGAGAIGILTIYSFIKFYTSDARMEQEIKDLHGRSFINTFFRIYFPVFLLAIGVQLLLTFALLPPEQNGWGVLDQQSLSPSGMIIYVVAGIVTAIGVIALSDYQMKKENLTYSQKTRSKGLFKSVGYGLPLLGIYFGVTFFLRFIMEQIWGRAVLIPSQSNIFEIDSGLIRAARFWLFLTDAEKQLVLVGFVLVYLAIEVLLRGLVAREAEGYKFGGAGMVFIPAVLQAAAFTNGLFLFTDTGFYIYAFTDTLLLAMILGLVLWRTGNFPAVVLIALFSKLLNSQEEFQAVVLKSLPTGFGVYDAFDSTQTLADTIGIYMVYIQVALVVISPFIIIVAYEEVGNVLKALWRGLKKQWFGYLVLAIAFFLIDLVFSLISQIEFFGVILGFFVALIVIGLVLNFWFKVLPPVEEPPTLHAERDLFDGELPLDVHEDISFLERETPWYEKPKLVGSLSIIAYAYFLFISATYRQIYPLEGLDILKFIIFLVLLPTLLIGFGGFVFSNSISSGFFFSEDWRKSLYWILGVIYVINILIWTEVSATVQFQWRNIPFFVPFALLIWPKVVNNPTKDYAMGLAKEGRYATFRWALEHPDQFELVFEDLLDLPSDTVQAGAYILAGKLNILDKDIIIQNIRDGVFERGEKIGAVFALGLMGERSAEGLLLDLISEEDEDVAIAAFWSLGRIASENALNRMVKVLEGNPKKNIVNVAENAILNIDPNYPLAGLRDSIVIASH